MEDCECIPSLPSSAALEQELHRMTDGINAMCHRWMTVYSITQYEFATYGEQSVT